jgi:hypothetical protein
MSTDSPSFNRIPKTFCGPRHAFAIAGIIVRINEAIKDRFIIHSPFLM